VNQRAVDLANSARSLGMITDWDHTPGLGALFVTGADAVSFLQSQLTSDVAELEPGRGQLSARIDRHGRLLFWFSLHQLPNRGQVFPLFMIILPQRDVVDLMDSLEASVVSEDIIFTDVSGDCSGVLVQGPNALSLIDSTQAWDEFDVINWVDEAAPLGAWVIRRSFTGDSGVLVVWFHDEVKTERSRVRETAQLRCNAIEFNNDDDAHVAWHWLTMELGLPELGRDLEPGQRILSQTGLEQHAISWTKGCYLGQEVLARVRAYGSPPETLRGLVFHDSGPFDVPEPGTLLTTSDGTKIGTWARAGFSPTLKAPLVLAFLKRDHSTPGSTLELAWGDECKHAKVALLPIHRAGTPAEQASQLYNLAVTRFRTDDDQDAVTLLEEALRLHPEHSEALEALGVILGRLHRYEEGIAVFQRLEHAAPNDPMVHVNLSLYYMKLGDKEEAERQKALGTMKRFGVSPDQVEASEIQAADDAQRKLSMFKEVLEIDPGDPLALMGAGDALASLGESQQAATMLAQAQAAQPENSTVYLKYGRVLESLEQRDEAIVVYHSGIKVASRRGDLMPLREMEHRIVILQASTP
jgi:folate-binding protein YgfZ